MLPNQEILEQISQKIKSIPNRRKESKRGIHYGLFLLGYKSGLRVNEAIKFNLEKKTKQGLYRIEKPKGKSERLVYVPKEVIKELKADNWQPNQTNRWNFYHFLKKIKRELNISKSIELSPHTLRHSFATYHAEAGLLLPILQKLLGHSSIRTTALYWQNIYGEVGPVDILVGKKWLENREKEPPKPPIAENFPQSPKNPDSDIVKNKPLITAGKSDKQDNSPLLIKAEPKLTITSYQPQLLIGRITPKNQEKFSLNASEKLPVITNGEQPISKEQFLLTKIKQLEEQLNQTQAENNNLKSLINSERKSNQSLKEVITNLTHQIQADEQSHTDLLNAYQKALKDKVKAERQVNYYESQLKTIAKSLYQWSKIRYYQQLEQEAKIEQPLPFRPNK